MKQETENANTQRRGVGGRPPPPPAVVDALQSGVSVSKSSSWLFNNDGAGRKRAPGPQRFGPNP